MTNKFPPGTRVRIYCGDATYKGRVYKIYPDGLLSVAIDKEEGPLTVHHYQCRRLVKKKRRRIWVHPDLMNPKEFHEFDCDHCISLSKVESADWREFVEVKPK